MEQRSLLDPEVAKRVASLTLRARRTVEGLLSGMHRSPHRGASAVFLEHREYRPGDDPRLLDWRAFARTDRHSIKRFEQETHLRATLVLDRSGSMAWAGPSGGPTKIDHAATLLSALAFILIRQGDAVSAVGFNGELGAWLPARSRPAHLQAVLASLAEPPVENARTNLGACLTAILERSGRRGVVAIASDLLDFTPDSLAPLARLVARGHDVLVLHVLHADELSFPFQEAARFVGLEGEAPIESDSDAIRQAYLREVATFLEATRLQCTAAGARYVLARTDDPAERILAALLSGTQPARWS